MWKFLIGLFIGFFLATAFIAYAGLLQQPPVDRDISVQTRHYLKAIADNHNNFEILTTNPDGSRRGRYGDAVILSSGGNYYIEICVSSPTGTVWRGVGLTDTP